MTVYPRHFKYWPSKTNRLTEWIIQAVGKRLWEIHPAKFPMDFFLGSFREEWCPLGGSSNFISWWITMVIVSPQDLGLPSPLQLAFWWLKYVGVTIHANWDDPPSRLGSKEKNSCEPRQYTIPSMGLVYYLPTINGVKPGSLNRWDR